MTNRTCEEIRDKLVDYADGELSLQEAEAVGEHLAECSSCRDLVRGLERSLSLAQAIWRDNLQGSGRAPAAGRRLTIGCWARRLRGSVKSSTGILPVRLRGIDVPPMLHGRDAHATKRRLLTHPLRIAAAILVTVGGVLVLCFLQKPADRTATCAQIEQQATRAAAAARLLVATQILAGCEEAGPLVERQRQYILNNYPDTPAAAKLRTANSLILGDPL